MVAHMLKVALVSGALLLPALPPAQAGTPVTPVGASGQVAAAGRESLFGTPMFLPVRDPARVSCVRTNCRQHRTRQLYHGTWAMDLLGERGDPIHAAGSGIVHVNCTSGGCEDSKVRDRGKWLWIDHGGGEVTKYYHLDRIRIREGQAVTPDTVIGDMGSTGRPGLAVNYLHFERRITNKTSRRVYFGPLWACRDGRSVSYPQAVGYGNWDDIPKLTVWVRSDGTRCIRRPQRAGAPDLVQTRAKVSSKSITMVWKPPARADVVRGYRVSVSMWHPTTSNWGDPVYYTVRKSNTSWSVPDLLPKRTYRVKVAAIDAGGYSPWSQPRDTVVANAPPRPVMRRLSTTKRSVHAAWRLTSNGGNRIRRFQAQLSDGSTVVRAASLSRSGREVTWTGLRRKTRYLLSIVAVNQAGRSAPLLRRVRTR